MKPRLLLSAFSMLSLVGCKEEGSTAKTTASASQEKASEERLALKSEVERAKISAENAEAEFLKSADDLETLRGEEQRSRSDLRILEDQRRELTGRLKALEEEKAKIGKEIVAFQKRWDAESEGFEEGVDKPLIEVYRELLEGQETARAENRELKEKLKKYEGAPEAR